MTNIFRKFFLIIITIIVIIFVIVIIQTIFYQLFSTERFFCI